jgi:hypothetical protein
MYKILLFFNKAQFLLETSKSMIKLYMMGLYYGGCTVVGSLLFCLFSNTKNVLISLKIQKILNLNIHQNRLFKKENKLAVYCG